MPSTTAATSTFHALASAVEEGLIDEATIDTAVRRLFEARFRLGMFDSEDQVPYARIGPEVVGCDEHRRLARQRTADKKLPFRGGHRTP